MGAVAASTLAAGGQVHGVIPTAVRFLLAGSLVSAVAHSHVPQFLPSNYTDRVLAPGEKETTTTSMHERKAIMSRESCAFVGTSCLCDAVRRSLADSGLFQVFPEALVPSRSAPR